MQEEVSFTLDDISEERKQEIMDTLSENDVIVFEQLSGITRAPFQSEAYAALICTEGHATCKIEEQEYVINKNDVFISRPNTFVENALLSYNFKSMGIVMSPKYFEGLLSLSGGFWEAGFILHNNPLIHLTEEEAQNYCRNFMFLKWKLSYSNFPHMTEIKTLILKSMMLEFYDTISPKLTMPPKRAYSTAEMTFRRFVKLVEKETPRQREVGYYASKLCITPKYLSAICKEIANRPASAIINESTAKQIKLMLRSSEMTIKEIAREAGFDNLSFFGKYVKRELGMSPREYRTNGIE